MKFNTLTFDANLPTVQQVNVPTNSDYKVGMKVKRNGSVQSIKPSEYTIYTGEINVIPPTDYTSTTKTCEDASSMNLLSLKEADLSAVAGQKIKYTDVYVEFSFDNGTTWSKLVPEVNSVMVQVIDRAGGTNNYIARLDLRNQNQKWVVLDHNVPTGEVADYVIIPDAARMSIQFLGSDWGSLTYPCLWRFIFLYGGQEIPITIPTDADKTNGYVTFTQAAGDDASFRQLKVAVEHGYNYNDTYTVKGQFPATAPDPNPSILAIKASDLGLAGVEIHASDYERLSARYWRKNTPQPADLSAWTDVDLWTGQVTGIPKLQLTSTDGTKYCSVYHPLIDYTISEIDPANPALIGFTFKAGEYYFVEQDKVENTWQINNITKTKTFGADETMLYIGALRFTANYYWGRSVSMAFGTPFSADFKLNINEFKSQSGDIAETLADGSSVKVEGTYADGTTFSFDFCTK